MNEEDNPLGVPSEEPLASSGPDLVTGVPSRVEWGEVLAAADRASRAALDAMAAWEQITSHDRTES